MPPGHAGSALESRVNEIRGRLGPIPPAALAKRTGSSYLEPGSGRGKYHLVLIAVPVVITYPDSRVPFESTGDIPSTCEVLFDANAGHYHPAGAHSILGGMLTPIMPCRKLWEPGLHEEPCFDLPL